MTATDARIHGAIEINRWPTELPLLVLCILVSVVLYLLLLLSVIGFAYALAFAAFFFVAHAAFMAQIRGSAVRLGPDQFPALHHRVEELARRMGMEKIPDAYLMQAGGMLNAFATRFLGRQVIVLYSELLTACGDNEAARDMIIAHELGHLKAGHLKFHWLILPASLVPFLGTALSRAREYTCDRYGMAGAGDRNGALLGLTVLAAGGKHAPAVNRQAFARQHEDMNTGWIRIGEWMGTHPPLARRIAALEPALLTGVERSHAGTLRALLIIGIIAAVVVGGGISAAMKLPTYLKDTRQQAEQLQQLNTPSTP